MKGDGNVFGIVLLDYPKIVAHVVEQGFLVPQMPVILHVVVHMILLAIGLLNSVNLNWHISILI